MAVVAVISGLKRAHLRSRRAKGNSKDAARSGLDHGKLYFAGIQGDFDPLDFRAGLVKKDQR